MCRLMGAVLFDGHDDKRDWAKIRLALNLLMINGEKAQGGHGNGIAMLQKNDDIVLYKSPLTAEEDILEMMNALSEDNIKNSKYIMMHTRLATSGSSLNPLNLHPFIQENVVGAHNGIVWNYQDLFEDFEKTVGQPATENDSEIIFALLDAFAPTLEPTAVDATLETLEDAVLAITAFSREDTNKILLASRDNPLAYYLDQEQGILWYASTPDILADSKVCGYTDAVRLSYEMVLIDWATHEMEIHPISSRRTYGWGGSKTTKKYSNSTLTYFEDEMTGLPWASDEDVKDIDLKDIQDLGNTHVACICEGEGELTQEQYELYFGMDFLQQHWYENKYNEIVVKCPSCHGSPYHVV